MVRSQKWAPSRASRRHRVDPPDQDSLTPEREPRDRSPAFWEEVYYHYKSGEMHVRDIMAKFDLTQGEFNHARQKLGWPLRKPQTPDRKKLIDRLFILLDRMLKTLESEMTTAGDKEVAALGRMVHAMSKLIALEDTGGTAVTARDSKEMEDIRSKLVARIAELKRN